MKTIPAIAIVAFITLLPPAMAQEASASASGVSDHCTTYALAKILLIINAGQVNVCISFDEETPAGTSPYVVGRASGPDNGAGSTLTYTWSIVAGTLEGCAAGTLFASTFQNAAASGSTVYFETTMTSAECKGVLQLVLTAGATQLVVWNAAWNTDATVTDFNNAVTGGLTVTDDAGGWSIHQDPISGGLTVTDDATGWVLHQEPICPPTAPCYHVVDSNSNVTVIGDISTNVTNEPPKTIWDVALEFAPLILGFLLLILGEIRSDNAYRAFAGVCIMFGALFGPITGWLANVLLFMFGLYIAFLFLFEFFAPEKGKPFKQRVRGN